MGRKVPIVYVTSSAEDLWRAASLVILMLPTTARDAFRNSFRLSRPCAVLLLRTLRLRLMLRTGLGALCPCDCSSCPSGSRTETCRSGERLVSSVAMLEQAKANLLRYCYREQKSHVTEQPRASSQHAAGRMRRC